MKKIINAEKYTKTAMDKLAKTAIDSLRDYARAIYVKTPDADLENARQAAYNAIAMVVTAHTGKEMSDSAFEYWRSLITVTTEYEKADDGTIAKDEKGKKIVKDVNVTLVPSHTTAKKFLSEKLFAHYLGIEYKSCCIASEKNNKSKKSNHVDFGSMSAEDVINGMSPEKYAEYAAIFAARAANAAA